MRDDIRRLIEREQARFEAAVEAGDTVAAEGAQENLYYLWNRFIQDNKL